MSHTAHDNDVNTQLDILTEQRTAEAESGGGVALHAVVGRPVEQNRRLTMRTSTHTVSAMKTLQQMILDAEQMSAQWLMKANDLREKGKTCIGCGCGFVPRIPGSVTCPKCLRSLKAKDGRP